MKRQIIALLAGTALLVSPLMSHRAIAQKAQSPAITSRPARTPKLHLTNAQKAQLKAIRAGTQAKIRAVLTPEQRTQFDAARAAQKQAAIARRAHRHAVASQTNQPKGHRNIIQSLNLTTAQKAAIQRIHQAAKPQIDAVYTNVQHAQLDKIKADRQAHKAAKPKG